MHQSERAGGSSGHTSKAHRTPESGSDSNFSAHSEQEEGLPKNSGDLQGAGSGSRGTSLQSHSYRSDGPPRHAHRDGFHARPEDLAATLVENSADCTFILDKSGRVQSISMSGLRALGMEDSHRIVGSDWSTVWNATDAARVNDALQAARAGNTRAFAAERSLTDGSRSYWNVKIAPVMSPDGSVDYLVAICHDMTELHRMQAATVEAERQSTAGRLAATIAHEINNPLEAVTNFIYLARTTDSLGKTAAGYLEMADAELTRAAQISRQMLGFYKQKGRSRWTRMSDLVHSVLTILERKFRARQVSSVVRVDSGLEVYGNEGELRQALINLVGNALDASHAGGKVWIRVSPKRRPSQEQERGVRITVADNGHGMSRETRSRIFVPFFTTKRGRGTGIGLWVTKCMVEQHEGSLRVKSREGEPSGTVMSMFLPNARITIKRAEVA